MKPLNKGKLKRRLQLLEDLVDSALRSECLFFACHGPEAPIRDGLTCHRCACIHRAIKMGLVRVVETQYVRETPHGHGVVVGEGCLEQVSEITGEVS